MKQQTACGIYNFKRLMAIEMTRKGAIIYAEGLTALPWKEIKKYISVVKVTVTPT
jgi:hypothetical protein